MTEPREGWALTSNGRNYRKVTGIERLTTLYSWQAQGYKSKDRYFIPESELFEAEREALVAALVNVRMAIEKARKQLANAEKGEARLMKRMKEMEA